MTSASNEITAQFAPTLLDQAKGIWLHDDATTRDKMTFFCVQKALDSGDTRALTTKAIASQCGASESRLFRDYGRPLFENMIAAGVRSVEDKLYVPRRVALLDYATRLAIDKELSFDEALLHWVSAYGEVGQASAAFELAKSGLPNPDFMPVGKHAQMIQNSISVLSIRSGFDVPESIGLGTLHVSAASEQLGHESMSLVTANYILSRLG